MEHSYHYLMMAGHTMMHKMIVKRLADTELTLGQPKILDFLYFHDGMEQKTIAKACFIEPGTLTSILNRLETQGMVQRVNKGNNRRSYYIYLTDYGRELAKKVQTAFLEEEARVFEGISDEQRSQFLAVLEQLCTNEENLLKEDDSIGK